MHPVIPNTDSTFLVLSTYLVYIIMEADDINAYAQAPPPYAPLYAHVDDQYRYWYRYKHGM